MTEYFDDVLDCEYTVNNRKEYKSVKVWVTLGGPNVWIDTNTKTVELRWGCDSAFYGIPYDICNYIDEIFQEYYDAI